MCLRPIKIPNNSRVLSRYYLSKGFIKVPCGDCSECQQSKSLEWLYRAYWQFQSVKAVNGYALFDTLTYSNENLPYMSQFLGESDVDFPCFSVPDIQGFFNRLRSSVRWKLGLKKNDEVPLKYFLTSEYGTSEKGTHRPHYHIILYVYDNRLKPLDLSYMVSSCWKKGRTDGAKFNGKRYVLDKRYISAHSKQAEATHLHQYVAKYVEKDSEFSKVVKSRLYKYLYSQYQNEMQTKGESYHFDFSNMQRDEDGLIKCPSAKTDGYPVAFFEWLAVPRVHSMYLKAKHLVEQFHKQSIGFGEYLIENLDLPYLWKTGCQRFDLCKQNKKVIDIPLPMYYYRKIFQEQVYIFNKLSWQNTEIGKRYKRYRQNRQIENLAHRIRNTFRFHDAAPDKWLMSNYLDLARYGLKFRDSVGYVDEQCNIADKLNKSYLVSCQNKSLYHGRMLSKFYHDESKPFSCHLNPCISLIDYVERYKYRDSDFKYKVDDYDKLLDLYEKLRLEDSAGKQELFDKIQRHHKILHKQYMLQL